MEESVTFEGVFVEANSGWGEALLSGFTHNYPSKNCEARLSKDNDWRCARGTEVILQWRCENSLQLRAEEHNKTFFLKKATFETTEFMPFPWRIRFPVCIAWLMYMTQINLILTCSEICREFISNWVSVISLNNMRGKKGTKQWWDGTSENSSESCFNKKWSYT